MTDKKTILVVGGGVSGITSAIEAAEVGYHVVLLEKRPYLGGRVIQMSKYFPKLCNPSCGLEINFKRIKQNPNICFYTLADVERITGKDGGYEVEVTLNPRYVKENCTCCGKCNEVCSMEVANTFNYGMDRIKGAYLPHINAFPMRYTIAPEMIGTEDALKCKESCEYHAIDLDMQPRKIHLKVGSIIWATGWEPYDATKIQPYGFGRYPNVITNVMMERLAAIDGPTGGRIVRPSDGKEVKRVAFIQCAGSRDENHLPFCSGICCLASMKHANYVAEQYPNCKIYIFFIDIRATDRMEDFYSKTKELENLQFFKGKVAQINRDDSTGKLVLKVEDTTSASLQEVSVDMVVLATGMQPNTSDNPIPFDVALDEYGFIGSQNPRPGFYAAGCARTPTGVQESVQDGTAAALKAIQSIVRR